ncbi:hypothetical protein UY456_07255 [Paenibacillus polymyxa]|uniref:hypothetical protein n=1 Tax=Paenibacillus polymyxa TaxID=1406 RepID=UPI002AB47A97|nr:hypothetical protein [Paenibacillus polymyxa]MDY8092786.1 hypothetical protein [Paenibacillus polymyxa]
MNSFTAFVDESGNSGVKIFNGTDKFHWVGVLLSPNNVELVKEELHDLLKRVMLIFRNFMLVSWDLVVLI